MTDIETGGPAARTLPMQPDEYRPGPIDLAILNGTDWGALDRGPGNRSLPELVRALVAARDDDAEWEYLMWSDIMGAAVHQGDCFPATAVMVPVLAELATSSGLTAPRRLDLHMALVVVAGRALAEAVDVSPTQIDRWAAEQCAVDGSFHRSCGNCRRR